jgi:Tfp pilus assembly protein PilN
MIRLNLLATRESKKKETMQQQVLLGVFMLILTLAVIGYFHVNITKEIEETNNKKIQVDKELTELQGISKTLEEYKAKEADLKRKKTTIETLEAERNGQVLIFAELTERIPPEVWIDTFTQNGMTLEIHGYSIDNQVLSSFVENLEDSDYVTDANLTISKFNESSSVYEYNMKIALRYSLPVSN